MKRISQARWKPSEGIDLEPNADTVVRSISNHLVVAGPGAGKTELLAQRACFLLETNLCTDPRRILAISFKRDAADNLGQRVRDRCDLELSARFDSHTFDSFAKSLLDRFREGLGAGISIPPDYEIETDAKAFNRIVEERLKHLQTVEPYASARTAVYLSAKTFVEDHLCASKLEAFASPSSQFELVAKGVWLELLRRKEVVLSFDMIKRLAERIVHKNPQLARALRITYSHVFLDEYQDTTYIQYDLLRTCFPNSGQVFTAVGDNKQRIMIWAKAMPEAFERFVKDYEATQLNLLRNRRSDCRLVAIQDHLIAAIDPTCPKVEPAPDKMAGDGICEILSYPSEAHEAEGVACMIEDLVKNRSIGTDEICVIAKQKVAFFANPIIEALAVKGIRCRVEEPYQLLMKDELVMVVLSFLRLALGSKPAQYWPLAFETVCRLDGVDSEDVSNAYPVEARLDGFLIELGQELKTTAREISDVAKHVDRVIAFLSEDKIRANFRNHKNPKSLRHTINGLSKLVFEGWPKEGTWVAALDNFEGLNCVPAMTIHKSKGLEYHSVFFIGLEDSSWWNFAKQPQEDTCAFFVAFSRAKKEVFFTFCLSRINDFGKRIVQKKTGVSSLYELLTAGGVQTRVRT